jgi:hypothetical protein
MLPVIKTVKDFTAETQSSRRESQRRTKISTHLGEISASGRGEIVTGNFD